MQGRETATEGSQVYAEERAVGCAFIITGKSESVCTDICKFGVRGWDNEDILWNASSVSVK